VAQYLRSSSPVFTPVAEGYTSSARRYECAQLTDLDFLEMGMLRCLTDSRTGRD
jgi:hypothetical protein